MVMMKMARMTQTLTKMTFQRCAILIVGSEATAKVASVFATRGGEVGIRYFLQKINFSNVKKSFQEKTAPCNVATRAALLTGFAPMVSLFTNKIC